jgi:glycosidase
MHVILDIAVNHTAWDHEWVKSHPEYYTRVDPGSKPWKKEWMSEHPEYFKRLENLNMTYPIHHEETDWWDVSDLNFDNKSLGNEFRKIFRYWITEFGADGYRCDAAAWVPADFWDEIRASLDSIGPVFMLAEADMPEHHKKAFDISYDWKLHHIFNDIAGKKDLGPMKELFTDSATLFTSGFGLTLSPWQYLVFESTGKQD